MRFYPTMAHLPSVDFPKVRVFGSIGWVASEIFILVFIKLLNIDFDGTHFPFYCGAAVSIVAELLNLTLPNTPPLAKGKKSTLIDAFGLGSVQLMKDRNFASLYPVFLPFHDSNCHVLFLFFRVPTEHQYSIHFYYNQLGRIGSALLQLLKADPITGKLKLPLSTSPEIGANTASAWLTSNSNNDLALLHWLFAANAEMAKALSLKSEAAKWETALRQLDGLATEGNHGALRLSPDQSLTESHRHHSHLMAIYPLNILNNEGTANDRAVIASSLRQLDSLGAANWMGYSHAWAACMMTRCGLPDSALNHLHRYLKATRRNGFHCNKPDDIRYTLEGNFAAAQAIHEMLIQSWGGKIRVFPALPTQWKEASFYRLRAEGGFIVSARRKAGRTMEVSVTATVDQRLKLVNPFEGKRFLSNLETETSDGLILRDMKAGETLVLKQE